MIDCEMAAYHSPTRRRRYVNASFEVSAPRQLCLHPGRSPVGREIPKAAVRSGGNGRIAACPLLAHSDRASGYWFSQLHAGEVPSSNIVTKAYASAAFKYSTFAPALPVGATVQRVRLLPDHRRAASPRAATLTWSWSATDRSIRGEWRIGAVRPGTRANTSARRTPTGPLLAVKMRRRRHQRPQLLAALGVRVTTYDSLGQNRRSPAVPWVPGAQRPGRDSRAMWPERSSIG